jgi:hypothetical protein
MLQIASAMLGVALRSSHRVDSGPPHEGISVRRTRLRGGKKNNQNKFEKVGKFSASENDHLADHVDDAIHHNFTTKKPHAAHRFFQNHPQKHQQSRPFPPAGVPGIFFWKLSRIF